jgi:hypothetical protein
MLVACSETAVTFAGFSSIPLHGRAVYADGTPAPAETLDFSLLANGTDLFPAQVNGCSPGDRHAQALQIVSVSTDPDGIFSLNAPMTGFVRATDESCPMAAEAAARLSHLDVRAQTNADFNSCIPYCRKYSSETCYADCAGHRQKFIWTSTLTPAEVGTTKSIRFETLGPPLAGTSASDPAFPDLRVDGDAARTTLRLTHEDFLRSSCALQDACVGAPGRRTLLRFDANLQNLGSGDLQIGSPENNPLFSYSVCHQHFHLKNIMTFELLDRTGAAAIGDNGRIVVRKQGFCIQGVVQIAGDSPNPYDCDNQGLAPGWSDTYASTLTCQWLDVTGVPAGEYVMRITVNASHTFPESDFGNNSELIAVSLP